MYKIISKKDIVRNRAAYELFELQPPEAPDDLLESFADFQKYRWFIDLSVFNEKLMLKMAQFLRDNLDKRGKVNRRDLFSSLRKMAARIPDKTMIGKELSDVLFEIFERLVISGRHNFSKTCINGYQQAIDTVLKDVILSKQNINTLLNNAHVSFRVVKRILDYPSADTAISMWAIGNFENNRYRHKRIKLLAWILDDNPAYNLSAKIIQDDHDFFNDNDTEAYNDAELELLAELNPAPKPEYVAPEQQAVKIEEIRQMSDSDEEDFSVWSDDLFSDIPLYSSCDMKDSGETITENTEKKTLTPGMGYSWYIMNNEPFPVSFRVGKKLAYRYYYLLKTVQEEKDKHIRQMDEYFNSNKTDIYNMVCMYGIYHSHLDMDTKTRLMKEYYHSTHDSRIFLIARKQKNVEFLEWMMREEE